MKKITSPVKHVPQRTCVACRKVRTKRELIRLVRLPGGDVEVDMIGRERGRGAYLCRAKECWDAGLKGGRLERSLKTAFTNENKERLIRFGESGLEE
jgi:predicted RNA-binding protein YlxR (DUF448 family)